MKVREPCTGCNRPMRSSNETKAQAPHAVRHCKDGRCDTCVQRERRGSVGRRLRVDGGIVDLPSFPYDPRPWTEQALCTQVDGDLFFPEMGGSTAEAKAVCRKCPVRVECLEWALDHHERYGVWGGLSERERRRLSAA